MPQSNTLDTAAKLVAAFVSSNSVPTGELPALIQTVHAAMARLSDRVESPVPIEETKAPAVSIRKSITPEYLICLEDGNKFKSLKRHLAGHGLTPEQYRAKTSGRLSRGRAKLRSAAIGDGESDRPWTDAGSSWSAHAWMPAEGNLG